jgi:hypothetical protein
MAQWIREFKELGVERVRAGLLKGGWEADKRRAAKHWLERTDASDWQAERPPDSNRGTFFLNLRNARWWGYATVAMFLVFGLWRLWKKI